MEQRPLLRLPAVLRLTGLSRSTIYKLMAAGEFPPAHKITRRAVAWCSSEIDQWVDSRTSRKSDDAQRWSSSPACRVWPSRGVSD